MPKSIKLNNDTYIDSSGITHNKETLKNILNNFKGQLVMAITVARNKTTTMNNQNIPFDILNKIFTFDGCDASLSNGVVTLTLPSGNYVAKVNASIWTNNNSWDYILLNIYAVNSIIARAMAPKPYGAWGFVLTEGITKVKNGTTLSTYINTNGNDFNDNNITYTDTKMDILVYRI